MLRSTLMCVLATSVLLTSGCVGGAQKVTESLSVPALYVGDGYLVDAAVLSKVLAVDDPTTRHDMFYDNSTHLQDAWVVDRDTLLWLLKLAARGRREELEGG